MAFIINPEGKPLNKDGKVGMDAMIIPSFKASYSIQKKTDKNFLIYVVGGLGDAICAEPSIRYAVENFDCEFTIATWWPEIYRHLKSKVKEFISFRDNPAPDKDYYDTHYVMRTLYAGDTLHAEFMPHMFVNVIDYHSVAMLRMELDPKQKNVILQPSEGEKNKVKMLYSDSKILIHPGKTWASRTMPPSFWNDVIKWILVAGYKPTIIGSATEKDAGSEIFRNVGTVGIDTMGCLDLRGKLSVMEGVALCQQAHAVITNDSSPVHMAASGEAFIGVISTVKRPDLLWHWRGKDNRFGWRMDNLSRGGLWKQYKMNPCVDEGGDFSACTEEQMASWLPDPRDVAAYAYQSTRHLTASDWSPK